MYKLLFFLFYPFFIFAQINSGTVDYSVKVFLKEELKVFLSDKAISEGNAVKFKLKFNQQQSEFAAIGVDSNLNANYKLNVMHSKTDGIFYKENLTSSLLLAVDHLEFGKIIIQFDNNLNWVTLKENKIINGNICYKATSTANFNPSYFNKPVQVVAWYCPAIAASFGPKGYGGLPGLILELTEDNVTFLAEKIIINPDVQVIIKKPTDGNLITTIEYKKMIDDFVAELRPK